MIRVLLVTLCLLTSAAQADTINPLLAKSDLCGRFELYHINGVMTTPTGAQDNLNRINAVYGNAYNGHLVQSRLAYNQTRSFVKDFLDSAKQIINLYAMATWDKWMNAVTFGIYSPFMDATVAKAVADKVAFAWGFTRPNPYTDQEMNEIMAVIQANTSYGSRVVLLPHSQGNFYASLVYDKMVLVGIKPAKSIGVVGLAVPYSSVRTGNVFITSWNDVIVDAVRLATLNNVLTPTVYIPYQPTVDVFGHKLIQTYMAHGPTQTEYKKLINAEFGTLKTVTAQPSFPYLPHATVGWTNCGPGSPWPGGCYLNGQLMMTPYVYYYPPATVTTSGYDIITKSPGTMADAVASAIANAAACQSAGVAQMKQYKLTGAYPNLPNCGAGAIDAWFAYSADATLTKTTQWLNMPYSGSASALIGPVCKN